MGRRVASIFGPCNGLPIVEELPKSDRKGLAFEGTHAARAEGESIVTRARALPIERRQVAHLISSEVLCRSRLWGAKMMVKAEATSSSHGRTLRDRTITRSLPQSSGAEQPPDGLSSVLADLNSKVFPRDQTLL
ncbi:hypothetical protein Bca52824_011311 [Brassica carinata]|uniref:Uncharacterized protein n=1 Tax=Brassica carinata TaxID=52824 RepID=A0A8X8BBP8_BRACI|nr:hypothetical protein Bca52824_011311 [Brassica carinata]